MGFGKNGTGVIIREDTSFALGTIANKAAVQGTALAIVEDFRMLKSEVFAVVTGLTANEGEGLLIGIANGELSAAEVGEAINAGGPLNRNDAVRTERSLRFCNLFGAIQLDNTTNIEGRFRGEYGSPMMIIKPRWTFSDPEGWHFFVYNQGLALTTGATLRLNATNYGVWVT